MAYKHQQFGRFLIAVCLVPAVLGVNDLHAQAFSYEFIIHDMAAVDFADAAWGDADLDGDFDLIVTGLSQGQFPSPFASAYFNSGETGSVDARGDSIWTQSYVQVSQGLTPVWMSAAAWADVDGDGAPDLVIAGARNLRRPFNPVTAIYRLSGARFVELPTNLPGVYGGSLDWGDYDNDGDSDLLITGETDDGRLTAVYENQGAGSFVEVDLDLPQISIGDARFIDFDVDGDLDIVLTGDTGTGFVTALFRNDGGLFVEIPFAFPPLAFSSLDWADYDNDGDPDLLLAGGTLSPLILDGHAYVFRNDGDGVFTDIHAELDGMFYGAAHWGDYDNDGLSDIMLSGASNLEEQRLGRLYHNEGNGVFRLSINVAGLLFSAAAFGDYDGDGDLDLVQFGDGVTNQYRNDHLRVNDHPSSPTGLSATSSGESVTLSWDASFDEQTPAPGLSYNLRVGSAPGAIDVVNPLANVQTGRRLVSGGGNVHQNRSWTLTGLTPGDYFWAVQALDNANNGSPFSAEGSFTIQSGGDIATSRDPDGRLEDFRLVSSYPNPFSVGTSVEYSIPEPAHVEIAVFNALGERIRVLGSGLKRAGRHRAAWNGYGANGNPVGAGFYIIRLSDGARHSALKVVKMQQ
ncbi:MAG TPA: FG-GAP-like repeat-containing protein [Rhodothermales bacterium]|nr:FG-GAP-like repeat-containing protein [Rhodothermales bacterium]